MKGKKINESLRRNNSFSFLEDVLFSAAEIVTI
jgi:hypothetical protein